MKLQGITLVALFLFTLPQEHPGSHPEKQGHGHGHGGILQKTEEFRFEVVFLADEIRIYAQDASMTPLDLEGVTGNVQVAFQDPNRKGVQASLGPGDDHLSAAVHLSKLEEGKAEVGIRLDGLGGQTERSVKFTVPFKLARLVDYVCPMKCTAPQSKPGDCPKCGMPLAPTSYIYACPMHPHVTSRAAEDTCWICHMKLERAEEKGHGRPH